jgi:hypothetical protein
MVDHAMVRRQHADLDLGHCVEGDAAGDDLLERLRCRHGLPRRAPGLQ